MKRTISQREAHRLRRKVAQLEAILKEQKNRWSSEWPSSIVLHRIEAPMEALAVVRTARALGHAVVVTSEDQYNKLKFFGVKLS